MHANALMILSLVATSCTADDPVDQHVDADAADVPSVDAAITIDAPIDAPIIPPCSATADTCTGETICIAGQCEEAFGRIYDIRSIAVVLPTTDPDGAAWDFAGGAPDIVVWIYVNGIAVANTATVADQFSASFAGPFPVQPIGGGSLLLEVYDEDVTVDDLAFSCVASPLTAELLRSRRLSCVGGNSTLSLDIMPL